MQQDILQDALTKGLSKTQQQALKNAYVAIAGTGGLGSNIAVWLARAGVGNLLLIDFDKVELSNLNRQYYFLNDVGKFKTTALKAHLLQINPYAHYQTANIKITEENIPQLFINSDIICEALDNPADKAMLVSTLLNIYPEKSIIAASGIAGFSTGNSIHCRKVLPKLFLCGDENSDCANLPLCGARVGLCAAHQALTILRIILKMEEN